MKIQSLLELNELARRDAENYPLKRFILSSLDKRQGRHFVGIAGPRGVGKTVILKQILAESEQAFYISLDTLPSDTDLFEVVKKLHQDYGYQQFLLDEIHFNKAVQSTLKKLYDFLNIDLLFTSSVALAMAESVYDLSRRAVVLKLYPFSFREYMLFKHQKTLAPLTLEQIIQREWSNEHMRGGVFFSEYLRGGLLPFALNEPEPLALLANILQTVIMKDAPTVLRLRVDELDVLHKLLAFIGRSGVDGINYSALSRNLGITKYKAEQYIELLERAFILHRVYPKGTNVLKEPKVLMSLPYRLLYSDYENCVGGLREDFFVEAMRQCHQSFYYLKSTRGSKTPDFLLDDGKTLNTIIEIGGRGKGREQFKGIHADRKVVFADGERADDLRLPLFMLGYLS
jgi:hypothetical protein